MKYTLTNNSRVAFTAYAPMHAFKGWAAEGLHGSLKIEFDNLEIRNIVVISEISCFDTGDPERNRAMNNFFSLEKHPEASFVMTECREFCRLDNGRYRITVQGVLELAGIRRQLPITFMIQPDEAQIQLDLEFKWSFKAYGLKAPRLLFLTVRDIVDIKAHLEFTTTHK